MNVFKVNETDWVAHYSEEKAKAFYHDFTGIPTEDIEEYFEGQVPLSDIMYWSVEEVDRVDPNHNFSRLEDSPFGDCYKVPFSWVIKHFPNQYPGIIASTEY